MPDVDSRLAIIKKQSELYGSRARTNQSVYVRLKTTQLVCASAIPISWRNGHDQQKKLKPHEVAFDGF